MKKLVLIFVFLIINSPLFSQNKNLELEEIVISYNGVSTLFREKYEINLVKKKVYYINPIVNYLDVGEKYRTRVKIKRKQWNKINELISKIDVSNFDFVEEDQIIKKYTYSLEYIYKDDNINTFISQDENVSKELIEIFEIIRQKYEH